MRSKYALTILAMGSAAGVTHASAQTRFQWPDTAQVVADYPNIEDCLAAAYRITGSVDRREQLTVWPDTFPWNPKKALEPEPVQVRDAAAKCAARFVEAKLDLHDFAPAMQLFLVAGRDSDAATLVTRRIAAAGKSARERGAAVDSAVEIYLGAKPIRLGDAEALMITRVRATGDRLERLRVYEKLLQASSSAGDSAREMRVAHWIINVADSLTLAERQSQAFEDLVSGLGGQMLIYDALDVLTGLTTRLDSLRHSTAAYAALERGNWARATGERPEALQIPIGKAAASLAANYWYPSSGASAPRPTKGKVALLLFLEHTKCIGEASTDDANQSTECAMRMALARRLAARFPDLEIDVVMSTHGQFMYRPPTSLSDEAALINEWFTSYHVPSAVLGVTSTSFWRLPDPDDRRIDNPLPNVESYNAGKSWKVGSGSMFVIDAEGVIADAWRNREDEITQFIDVLLHRPHQGN